MSFAKETSVVTFDGMILDGRNRVAACAMADVEPLFQSGADQDHL